MINILSSTHKSSEYDYSCNKPVNKFGELTYSKVAEKDHKRKGKIRTKLSSNRNPTYPLHLDFAL